MAKRRGWKALAEEASSSDRTSRQGAITRAYAWVEQALAASGLKKGPTASRLLIARGRGMIRATVSEKDVRRAIGARHDVAHDINIPPPELCSKIITTLSYTWTDLRDSYVSVTCAEKIASSIIAVDGVLNVFLFGSLARKVRYPGDIDILIFDDGRYSSDIEENEDLLYEDTMRLTLECIKLLNLREATLKAAAKCRWVDMLLINGERLESDSGYRSRISGRQVDSNFFLNISNDLEEYSTTSNSFVETNVPLFRKLKRIAESLDALGFPPRSIRHGN